MRWIVMVLAVLAISGCGEGENAQSATQAETTPTASTSETMPTETQPTADPRSVDDVLAALPPFDVPPSPEVDAYRRASIGGFFDRCVSGRHGADERTFVKANRKVLDEVLVVQDAERVSEFSIDHRDGNGCPEGLGPPTSYTTYRNFRLPAGTPAEEVIAFYRQRLGAWAESGGTPCERTFTRGKKYVAVSACNDTLRLSVRALPPVEIPPPPKLPPRPYGAQYPVAMGYLDNPEPTSYESEPGMTCERISGGDVPSIIIPPTPGIRAELRNEPLKLGAGSFPQHVLVEWSFEQILGDCPPTELHLTLVNPNEAMPPLSLPFGVHARSGTQGLPVLDSFRDVAVLRATVESVDGARSRSVAVLIRR